MVISPTKAQCAFLDARGIIVPPTKGSCSLLISYIKQGNGTVGDDEGARIALTVSYQEKWIGKKVRTSVSFAKGQDGVVVYIGARDSETIGVFRLTQEGDKYHPFWANVRFNNGKTQMLSLSNLELDLQGR